MNDPPAFSPDFGYHDFANSVCKSREHIFTDESRCFLEALKRSMRPRVTRLNAGTAVHRVQRGCGWLEDYESGAELATPFPESRMLPTPEKTVEGRANKSRKPVFYGSNLESTAIREVRPWIGGLLTVGVFEVQRKLSVVDCIGTKLEKKEATSLTFRRLASNSKIFRKKRSLSQRDLVKLVWHEISVAFARPVYFDDDPKGYLPTQIIAELIQSCGYDGIAHFSSVGEGCNLIIFDLEAVKLARSRVVQIKQLSVEIEEGPFY